MLKKIVFVIALCSLGMGFTSSLSATTHFTHLANENLNYAEKVRVCGEMERRGIMDLNSLLELEKVGGILIRKTSCRMYRVVTPGGSLIADLELDNI